MLSEHFGFDFPARVDFVGGGGKTSLILRLGDELSERLPVLYTTTTRIHPPPVGLRRAHLFSDDGSLLLRALARMGDELRRNPRTLVVTREEVAPRLLGGVEPSFVGALGRDLFPLVLNEADGARSVSLKWPRDGEPVPSHGCDTLVAVIGLDCIGAPLGPDTLFRWDLAARRLGLTAGEILRPRRAAEILLHPEGVCRGHGPSTRLIVYVNKVDAPRDEPVALELAQAVLDNRSFPVERVVWGSLVRERAGSLLRTPQDR